jgi:hypothetical protein
MIICLPARYAEIYWTLPPEAMRSQELTSALRADRWPSELSNSSTDALSSLKNLWLLPWAANKMLVIKIKLQSPDEKLDL